MADPGLLLSIIELAWGAFKVIKNAYDGIKSAPEEIRTFSAEAECLQICLAIFTYEDCARALERTNQRQRENLHTILVGCNENAEELVIYVEDIQQSVWKNVHGKKRKGWRGWFRIPEKAKEMYALYQFSQTDKQPMRNKLAIPLQSLDIFLVSLTLINLPYNQRLSSGPNVTPANLGPEWAVVGERVAFKNPKFDASDLNGPGVEGRVIIAAHCIINGRCTAGCHPCCSCGSDAILSDDADGTPNQGRPPSPSPTIKRKDPSRRNTVTSDKMYLVRRRSKRGGRSKSAVRRVKKGVMASGHLADNSDDDDDDDKGGGIYRSSIPHRRNSSPLSVIGDLLSPPRPVPSASRRRASSPLLRHETEASGHPFRGRPAIRENPHNHASDESRSPQPRSTIVDDGFIRQAMEAGRAMAIQTVRQGRQRSRSDLQEAIRSAEMRTRLNATLFAEMRMRPESQRFEMGEPGRPEVRNETSHSSSNSGGIQDYMREKYGLEMSASIPGSEPIDAAIRSETRRNYSRFRHRHNFTRETYSDDSLEVSDASEEDSDDGLATEMEPPAYREEAERRRMARESERREFFTVTTSNSQQRNPTSSTQQERNRNEDIQQQQQRFNLEWERLLNERERMLREREQALAMRERELQMTSIRRHPRSPDRTSEDMVHQIHRSRSGSPSRRRSPSPEMEERPRAYRTDVLGETERHRDRYSPENLQQRANYDDVRVRNHSMMTVVPPYEAELRGSDTSRDIAQYLAPSRERNRSRTRERTATTGDELNDAYFVEREDIIMSEYEPERPVQRHSRRHRRLH